MKTMKVKTPPEYVLQQVDIALAKSAVLDELKMFYLWYAVEQLRAWTGNAPLKAIYGKQWNRVWAQLKRVADAVKDMQFYYDGLQQKDLDRNDLSAPHARAAHQAYREIPVMVPLLHHLLYQLLKLCGVQNRSIKNNYFEQALKKKRHGYTDEYEDEG